VQDKSCLSKAVCLAHLCKVCQLNSFCAKYLFHACQYTCSVKILPGTRQLIRAEVQLVLYSCQVEQCSIDIHVCALTCAAPLPVLCALSVHTHAPASPTQHPLVGSGCHLHGAAQQGSAPIAQHASEICQVLLILQYCEA